MLGAAAAVAGPPLSALARPPRAGAHDPRVVVVGAGLAGVSCAYKLQQHGIRADLYESRDRVGGRCWTARTFDSGQVAEHGGEFVDTRHVQLRRLVAALGLHLDDLFPAYEDEGDVSGLLVLDGERRDRHVVHEHFDVVIRRLVRDAKKVGPYRWGQAGPAARAFDQMTMREWMDANVPGGSSSLLGRSMDVGLTGFWGIDPEDTSAITLLDTYVTPYPGGPADERYHVRGGNDQVPNMLADLLPDGALHLESPLEAMRERADGSFELVFGGVASPVVADHVVLCLPFTTLRDVDLDDAGFDAKRLKAIRELGMGTNAKVLLQFDDRFPTFGWNGLFDLDAPKSDSWDSALAQPGPGGLLTIFTGGKTGAGYPTDDPHAQAPAGVVDDALTFLDTYLPGMRDSFNGRSWLDSWVDDPWVKGSYAAFLPGQWTSFFGYMGRPAGQRPLRGRAHVDVQPGLPERRRRDGTACGPRGDPRDRTARATARLERAQAGLAGGTSITRGSGSSGWSRSQSRISSASFIRSAAPPPTSISLPIGVRLRYGRRMTRGTERISPVARCLRSLRPDGESRNARSSSTVPSIRSAISWSCEFMGVSLPNRCVRQTRENRRSTVRRRPARSSGAGRDRWRTMLDSNWNPQNRHLRAANRTCSAQSGHGLNSGADSTCACCGFGVPSGVVATGGHRRSGPVGHILVASYEWRSEASRHHRLV